MKRLFNHRIMRQFRALALLPLMMVSQNLWAEQTSATLAHIKSTNTLNIGYRQLKPFSYRDNSGNVTGYTISLCNIIADRLRVSLGIKTLAVHYIPVMFADRVSALNSAKIDLDCSVNTIAPERTNSVAFSIDYYVASLRITSLRKNNIHFLNDLQGRTISTPRGSKDLLELNKMNREKKLNLSILTTDTSESAFELMSQKHTVALLLDDVLAYYFINQSEHPQDFAVSHEVIGEKMRYALMMRKGDPLFVAFVNNTLEQTLKSPQHAQIANKWLTQDVDTRKYLNN